MLSDGGPSSLVPDFFTSLLLKVLNWCAFCRPMEETLDSFKECMRVCGRSFFDFGSACLGFVCLSVN